MNLLLGRSIEAAVGLLLIIGLLTRIAIVAGALLMILLMAGICLAQDWNMAGLQLIHCLIYFILLTTEKGISILSTAGSAK